MLVSAEGGAKMSGPLELESEAGVILQAGVLETKLARAVGSINCGAIFPVPHFIFFNRNNLGSYWLILSRQMSPTDHSWYWLQCEGRKTFPVQIRIVSISCLTIPVRAVTVAQNCSPQLCYFSIKTTIGKKKCVNGSSCYNKLLQKKISWRQGRFDSHAMIGQSWPRPFGFSCGYLWRVVFTSDPLSIPYSIEDATYS